MYERARAERTPLVLATVVATRGSTYRKAGAQMLIGAGGRYGGIPSGGSPEGDLYAHAGSVPESGTPAAVGFAEESGISYGLGLVKNSYVGRTFIQPSQTIRQLGIRLKLNPLREMVAGKRLVVVDDSIVRGNTQRALVRMLREAGVREVHVRISSPPVTWPCFYGIDFASRAELIATGLSTEEVCRSIGADSGSTTLRRSSVASRIVSSNRASNSSVLPSKYW